MPGKIIRISASAHKVLAQLAARSREPMQSVLDHAIEQYRRKAFLEQANAAFAALRKKPNEWKRELKERKVWDSTLADDIGE